MAKVCEYYFWLIVKEVGKQGESQHIGLIFTYTRVHSIAVILRYYTLLNVTSRDVGEICEETTTLHSRGYRRGR